MINKTPASIFIFVLLMIYVGSNLFAIHDLNDMHESFILETKKIEIPEYPTAFNPSITKWKGKPLMCFRIRDPLTKSTNQIGFVWLTDDFNLDGAPTVLKRFNEYPNELASRPTMTQEPRLITLNEELYLVYSNVFPMPSGKFKPRMVMSLVQYDGNSFSIDTPQPILVFEGNDPEKQEKNWVPFIYEGSLLQTYSISPHRVLLPVPLENACLPFSISHKEITWDWGVLRGGSPAQKIGDRYLAFFHSLKGMKSVQSDEQNMTHYFMGAYTFEINPPFKITGISSKPIAANSFYEGPMYQTWKPLRVVYPGGFIYDNDFIWVAYGRQDHEIWVVKLNRKGLMNSLKPLE